MNLLGKPLGKSLKNRLDLVRQEDGIALVLVVLLVALLAGLSATLIDQVTSESGRSTKAVSSQAKSSLEPAPSVRSQASRSP